MMVGRITAVAVVMCVGVMYRVQRVKSIVVARRIAARRRRQDGIVTVVVVAVRSRTVIVTHTRSDMNHHPRLGVRPVPAKTHWLKVLESGEAVKLVT